MNPREYQLDSSILTQIVESLIKGAGDRLVAVILFGSQARGEGQSDSDIDLFVIAQDLSDRHLKRIRFIKEMLPGSIRSKISIIAKTPEEFEASLPALYLDIALDGQILFDSERYAEGKLAELRGIIRRKGLRRERIGEDFIWRWKEFPGFGWSLSWEGSD